MRKFASRTFTTLTLIAAAGLFAGCSGSADLTTALDNLVAGASTAADTLSSGDATAATTVTALDDSTADDAALRGRGHHGPPGPIADLNLTDEQQTQARQIHNAARTDIEALATSAREQMRAVLTEEQQAKLDELRDARGGNKSEFVHPELTDEQRAQIEALHEQLHNGEITIEEFRTKVQEITGVELPSEPPFGRGGPRGRGGPGMHAPGFGGPGLLDGPFADRLAEALGLTDDQRAAIDAIRQTTREAVQARHEQARTEFRAILTAEQLAILDEWEANHPRPALE
ncbi:MAG: hypothetical protein JNG88_15220 [Phycisphaerales bacterium]|nr:hypothetical protein [Phycisphaerales bacterium]